MSEKEELICRLKNLVSIHREKLKKYQKDAPDGCGCITRESLMMVCLYPHMQKLGVTFDDIYNA